MKLETGNLEEQMYDIPSLDENEHQKMMEPILDEEELYSFSMKENEAGWTEAYVNGKREAVCISEEEARRAMRIKFPNIGEFQD